MIVYTIQTGDTLWKIAQANSISLDALIAANPQISDPNQIFIGQVINIPQLWHSTQEASSRPAASSSFSGLPIPEPIPQPTPEPAQPGSDPLPLPTPEVEPEMPCCDEMGLRPCIYLAHEGETLESIGHSFMIPLSRLLYFNLCYGKREPLAEGTRIIIPEIEIQPLEPLYPRSKGHCMPRKR